MSDKQEQAYYQIVRGFQCPISERFTKKNMEDAMDFVPGDGDLILASYPKTGTVWMQYILLQIKSKGELFPSFKDASIKFVPFIEMVGTAAVQAQDKPRFYKHHIAYNFVQKNEQSKVVYIYRNPEDTLVSYYHFSKSVIPDFQLDFELFFDRFITGNISYGSYFQHVLSFYEHRADKNLLMISYEKLQANREDEILKIAKFLGEEYYQSLVNDQQVLDKIMQHTSFEYMKKNLHFTRYHEESQGAENKVDFFRKGTVGDGKTLLTDAQRQCLKAAAEKVLKRTNIIAEWYPE